MGVEAQGGKQVRARVYIATTEGSVLVQRLAPEEGLADAELSAVCLNGTPTRLPITNAYTWFVRDHVRTLSGGAAYRMDLDRAIDGGSSWMLGAWSAHLLLSEGRLAMGDEAADVAVFATGEMAVAADAQRRVEVRRVDHVAGKIARLADRAAEEAAAGRRVLLLAPRSNAEEAESAVQRLAAPLRQRVTLRLAAGTDDVRRALGATGDAVPAKPGGGTVAQADDEVSAPPSDAALTRGGDGASAAHGHGPRPPAGDAAFAPPGDGVAAPQSGDGTAGPNRHRRERRRRGARFVALIALCAFVGTGVAGFAVWRNAEGEWERLRREGRYVALDRALDGFLVPMAAQRFRDHWRSQGAAAEFSMTVAARRPADGGSCSGMRFRRVSLVSSPVAPSGPPLTPSGAAVAPSGTADLPFGKPRPSSGTAGLPSGTAVAPSGTPGTPAGPAVAPPRKAAEGSAAAVGPSVVLFRLDRLRSLCGFTVRAASREAAAGHAWISLNFIAPDGAPAPWLPARRVRFGALAEFPVELSQDLPLYLQEHWAWTVTGVWAPRPSQDVAELLEAGDAEALDALQDVGLTVVRAGIEFAW